MSRPTHAMQQQEIDDALAALPSARWRWLFTPDPRWLASVNTTTLREVNAVRMFVGVTLLFAVSYLSVVGFALTRCGIEIRLLGHKVFQMTPPPGKLDAVAWRGCEDSLATGRMLDFADALFNSYGILLAAMATVAVGAMIGKRQTDTPHRVAVEQAKKAPIINQLTADRPALPPVQTTTVNVGADEPVAERPANRPTGDARVDDETGP